MKKISLAIAALSLALTSYGQRYMGVATGNWSGTNSLYLNPANLADNRAGFAFDLFSFNLLADNDLVKFSTSSLSNSSATGLGFSMSQADHFNMMMPYIEMRLFGAMLAVKKNSFAITSRARFVNQFNNFDQRIMNLATNPPTDPSAPIHLTANDFNWTGHAWAEIRFSYAREVYNEGDHFLKAGITASRLMGIGFIGIRGSVDGTFDPSNVSLAASNTDITMATSFYNSASQLSGGAGDGLSSFFGAKTGKGWGFDLGAVYEYRPDGGGDDAGDNSSNKYKVRGSVALTDIGSIKYDAATAHVTANGTMTGSDLATNIGNYSDFKSYAESRGFKMDTGIISTKVKMPTALVLGADYYVASHFYVNATYFMNMLNRSANFGNSFYNQISITPRWDTKIFSVGLPIAVNAMSGFKAGLGVRFGGLMFGTDDIFGVLSQASGVNAYFGAYVPINKKNRSKKSSAPALKPAADAPAPSAPKN